MAGSTPIPGTGGGELKLDNRGIGKIAKSAGVRSAIYQFATAAGQQLQQRLGGDVPLWLNEYVTDRRAVALTVQLPQGTDSELKYGYMADAATAVGLQVKAKGS